MRGQGRRTIPHWTSYPAGKQGIDADGARAELTAKSTSEAWEDVRLFFCHCTVNVGTIT